MESEQAKGTIEHVRKTSEAEQEDSKILKGRLSASSSVSSSSSSSPRASLEHDIVDNNSPLNDSIPKSKSDGNLSRGPNQAPERSMSSSAAPPPQVTSPLVQTMGHPSDYDPNRIPASVFASKPANALEWSMASNDSLFSIHVGNNSFTKDQFRSGELFRFDELSSAQSLHVSEAKSNELCSLPASLPPLMEVPANEESSAKSSCVSTLEKEEVGTRGPNTPRLSNESGRSTTSFAFPVLDGEGGKGSSLERVEEKPELQTQDSVNDTQNSTTGRWFSWCTCLPRCC